MGILNDVLKELGISKVKLAKYLGVSRQMIYNYLELNSLDEWPKDKKMKMFMLLNINSADELKDIKITSDYIMKVETILNNDDFIAAKKDFSSYDIKDLNKKYQQSIMDIVELMKDQLSEDKTDKMIIAHKYLYYFIQLLDDVEEYKYILAYFAKEKGFISPKEFAFNEDHQITFEGIMYQAMTLFRNGGASKSKVLEAHKRYVADIEQKKEEILSKTQEMFIAQSQALKELGYTELTNDNAAEVLEKMLEIQARKGVR